MNNTKDFTKEELKQFMENVVNNHEIAPENLIVTGMSDKDMEDFYDLCEKITLLEAVEEHRAESENEQENPNLTLSTLHLIHEVREKIWALYYYLEDNSFDEPLEL